MSAALLYRVSAILLLLFAAGHQLGFRKADARWGVTALIDGLGVSRRALPNTRLKLAAPFCCCSLLSVKSSWSRRSLSEFR